MNYFIQHLFRDRQFWIGLAAGVIVILNVFDLLTYSFASPGYFNLWLVRITVVGLVIGLVVYAIVDQRKQKRAKRVEAELAIFRPERIEALKKMVDENPLFQTFCYECQHYDNEKRGCRLHFYSRQTKIKLNPTDPASYCLYWNFEAQPLLLQPEDRMSKL